ncbi:hypothetical protein BD626DRAFT_479145 [Schizophyllum amplum]|uniref:F-box domain-containing protein n=1 Tax=Schizophyllum amplum TaxID=97359 RepID=A0A550CRZ4_9AGAR|nr:hypothetical protein BD626DRAFT_479145 [Auriculariopsis ampla]
MPDINPTPALPQELYDAAMEYLLPDLRTLRLCALVCRAWVPGARRLTHPTLHFPSHITPHTLRLLDLLECPMCTLPPTTRRLVFAGSRLPIKPPDADWFRPFLRFRHRFLGVRALVFRDLDWDVLNSDGWEEFWDSADGSAAGETAEPPAAETGTSHPSALQLETVSELVLDNVPFISFANVMDTVCNLPQLERLKFCVPPDSPMLPADDLDWARIYVPPRGLRELEITDVKVPTWFANVLPEQVPRLRVLKLGAAIPLGHWTVGEMVHSVARSLEELHFTVTTQDDIDAICERGLLRRTNLRHLRIAGLFNLYRKQRTFFDHVRACSEILSAVPAYSLENIVFEVAFVDYLLDGWTLMRDDASFWAELDMYLVGPAFPVLDEIKFVVHRDIRGITKKVLFPILPECVEENLIQIEDVPLPQD